MINYSIVMRSVNANLLEINQAKSRINQAKQEGKNPDQKDLDLVKTEKQNAFAISQYTDVMTIEKFAKHITSHGSVYSINLVYHLYPGISPGIVISNLPTTVWRPIIHEYKFPIRV